jgi:hypothetical protein
MEWIEKLFSADNAVFQGGFGLAVLAVGAQTLRFGSNFATNLARKHLLISLEITSKDRAYPWVLQWITAQGTRTQHLSVETVLKSTTNHSSSTIFNLVPGYHFIFYHNNFLGSWTDFLLCVSQNLRSAADSRAADAGPEHWQALGEDPDLRPRTKLSDLRTNPSRGSRHGHSKRRGEDNHLHELGDGMEALRSASLKKVAGVRNPRPGHR